MWLVLFNTIDIIDNLIEFVIIRIQSDSIQYSWNYSVPLITFCIVWIWLSK